MKNKKLHYFPLLLIITILATGILLVQNHYHFYRNMNHSNGLFGIKGEASIIDRLLSFFNKEEDVPKVSVLLYHHIVTEEEKKEEYRGNELVISDKKFAEQMKYLYENNYTTLTLDELYLFLLGGYTIPPKSVVITFDDGYRSNIELGYPILKQYGFTAAIFMITGYFEEYADTMEDPPIPWIPMISMEDMKKVKDVFQFESHTHNMHRIDENKKAYLISKSREEVKEDLKMCKEILDANYFAYPFGYYSTETIEILKELNYKMAFTIKEGYVKQGDDLFQLNRINIGGNISDRKFQKILKGSRE